MPIWDITADDSASLKRMERDLAIISKAVQKVKGRKGSGWLDSESELVDAYIETMRQIYIADNVNCDESGGLEMVLCRERSRFIQNMHIYRILFKRFLSQR